MGVSRFTGAIVLAFLLPLLPLAGCSAEVAADLEERDAQEAMALLSSAGISAERLADTGGKERTYRIEVTSSDAGKAAQVLRSHGLPRMTRPGFSALYRSSSMIPTATEEKARFLDALSGEIASHLERLEGVVDASVIMTVPSDDHLSPEAKKGLATASVLLRTRGGSQSPAEDDVRKLVAGAVEGLAPSQVAVVNVEAQAPPLDPAPFASVGPIRVARSSRLVLVAVLGASCALVILMGVWILLGERRAARLRGRLADLQDRAA